MIKSFPDFFLDNFLNQLKELSTEINNNNFQPLVEIINLFLKLIYFFTKQSNQIFSSNFARWVFLIEKFNLPQSSANLIKTLNLYKKRIRKNYTLSKEEIDEIINLIFFYSNIFIKSTAENQFEATQSNTYEELFLNPPPKEKRKRKNFYTTLISKSQKDQIYPHNYFICANDEIGNLIILFPNHLYEYIYDFAENNSNLHFINIQYNDLLNAYEVTANSYIIYEPDYLLDITSIAECFDYERTDYLIFFMNLLTPSKNSIELIKGTVINSMFDDLISEPIVDFFDSFHKAIKIKPLKLIALDANSKKIDFKAFKNIVQEHFNNLSSHLDLFSSAIKLIEPSFITNEYGLQGRLDLLNISGNEFDNKDVVELKSGNPPINNILFKIKNTDYYINSWSNHTAQATGYNLLLDSVFSNRKGNSSILYSADINTPLRNVMNIPELKNEFLDIRNKIIIVVKKIINNKVNIIDILNSHSFNNKFIRNYKDIFFNSYLKLNKIEKEYFLYGLQFILREDYFARIGDNDRTLGQSSLWNLSIEDKLDNFSVLNNLSFNSEESDIDKLHIVFDFSSDNENYHYMRNGDQCLIYPIEYSENPIKFYIIKGFIREITKDKIKISLLNKNIHQLILRQFDKSVVELDKSDSLIRRQLHTFINFIFTTGEKRKLLLGEASPTYTPTEVPKYDYLNENQQIVLRSAISANDYYLIQGPPGTGKTSRMLKAIAEYYYNLSLSNPLKILLCAYTNRAVDEICAALESIDPTFPYIRIAGKELTNFKEKSLPHLSDILTLNALKDRLLKTNFYVSTVSSLHTNPEIFSLINFDICILDEASQVLETQIIGILAKVNKFILIGDEKQLPAIVLQNNNIDAHLSENLMLETFADSLFHRLLKLAKRNSWDFAYSTLIYQGRMHDSIQTLANTLFYNNILKSLAQPWQNKNLSKYLTNTSNKINKCFQSRVTFINTPKDQYIKMNQKEAELVVKIIEYIAQNPNIEINEKTIGIISPFRLQCRAISNIIPQKFEKDITLDTVERFQGSEREIIIISLACNYNYLIENISNETQIDGKIIDRKFNVALTRAKEHIIIMGNQDILQNSTTYYNVIEWIKQNGTYINFEEIMV